MLDGPLRADLAQNELKEYLAKRRWFSAKDQKLNSVRFVSVAPLPGTGGRVVIAEVEAALDGRTERFSLPCATIEESEAVTALPSQLALARFRRGRRVGFITDAFASDPFAYAVLAAFRANTTIPIHQDANGDGITTDGELRFIPTTLLERTIPPQDPEIRRFSAEQSNSSLVIGDSVVLKIVRHLAPGIHPEVEMTRYLTEAGVDCIASLLGHAERIATPGTGVNAEPVTMLIAQSFVRNQGDGWAWTLDWLRRAMSEAEATRAEPGDPFAGYLAFATAVGRRLAEVHAALSAPCDDPAFSPEPATERDNVVWTNSVAASLETILDMLAHRDKWESADAEAVAQYLIEQRQPLLEAVRGLRAADGALLKTRVHGDRPARCWSRRGRRRDRGFRGRTGAKPRRASRQDLAIEGRRGAAAQLRLRRRDVADGERDGGHAVAGTAPGST